MYQCRAGNFTIRTHTYAGGNPFGSTLTLSFSNSSRLWLQHSSAGPNSISRIPISTFVWMRSPITLNLSDLLVSNGAYIMTAKSKTKVYKCMDNNQTLLTTSIWRSFFRGRPHRASGLIISVRSASSLGPESEFDFRLSSPLLRLLWCDLPLTLEDAS